MKNKRWLILLIVGFLLIPVNIFVPDASADPSGMTISDWSYYQTVTIESDFIETDLTNFPVLLVIPDATGDKCNGGDSIRFVNDGNTTEYYYEIEKWVDDSDRIVWANITFISSTVDTNVIMYYGNSGVSDNQSVADVWNDHYVMVQHMNASSGNIFDSTAYDNDGSASGSFNYEQTGQVGYGIDFVGVDDFFTVSRDSSIEPQTLTLEGWMKSDVYENNAIFDKAYTSHGDPYYSYQLSILDPADNNFFIIVVGDTFAEQNNINKQDVGYTTGTWMYFAMTFDGTDMYFYNNDNTPILSSDAVTIAYHATDLYIGARRNSANYEFNGILDELRISNVARNISWIRAAYNNTNQTEGFITFGSEQTQPGVNNEPTLTSSSIYPNVGNTRDTYYFNVTYTDADADVPGNITINITKWDASTYSNNSMSWISGDNITGAIFSYNTNNLGIGDYNFTIVVDDGNGSADVKIDPTLGAFSYSTLRNETFSSDYGQYGQGIATDGDYIFTSSKEDGNAYPGTLNNFSISSAFTHNRETELNGQVNHISDIYYKDGYIYVADVNVFDGDYDDSCPFVARFNADDFAYVDTVLNDVASNIYITEGVTFYDDHWWISSSYSAEVVWHENITKIRKYNTDWEFVDDYVLVNGSSDNTLHQSIEFVEVNNISYLFVSHHTGGLQIFRWNDTGFTEMQWEGTWLWARQGFQFNGTDNLDSVWFMNRVAATTNYVLEIDFDKASDVGIGPIVKTTNTPTLSGESPTNGSTAIDVTPSLYVTCTDADGDTMSATWYSNSSGDWVSFATNGSISTTDVIYQTNSNFSAYSTGYWWSVNLSDGTLWDNETYHFTTKSEGDPPVVSISIPSNNSIGVCSNSMELGVTVSDPDGDTMNITFWSNLSGVWDYFYLGTINRTLVDVANGTYYIDPVYFVQYNHVYYWNVSVSDSTFTTDSPVFSFTTSSSPCGKGGGGMSNNAMNVIGIIGIFGLLGGLIGRREIKRRRNN